MTEKYFVVSESELNELLDQTYADGVRDFGPTERRDKLDAACRAREVKYVSMWGIGEAWLPTEDDV